MSRPSWRQYFLDVAKVVSSRATCPRASVGAVMVRDNHIILTGYNGAPSGDSHCIDVGCDLIVITEEETHCKKAIHAEANVILKAAKYGISTNNCDMYIYADPYMKCCWRCKQILRNSGISVVYYIDA